MSAVVLVCVSGLAAIWLGYPLVVRVLAALRPRQSARINGEAATVTVVLASADDAAAIRNRVADLLATAYPVDRLTVVVALDRANARATPHELTDLDPRVMVVVGDDPGGKASSLNAAVRSARGEILVFTDTAQSFERDAISELVAALADHRFGAVSGSLHLHAGEDGSTLAHWYWSYERALREAEARLYSGVGVTGAIYAMRRELWQPLPPGVILDDVYTPMRLALAGQRIGFTSRAKAVDARRFTPAQEYRRKVRTLTGVIQLCVWLPGVLNPFRNPVWLQFVFHKLLRLATPYLAIVAIVALLGELGMYLIESGRSSIVYAGIAALIVAASIPRLRRALLSHLAWAWALQTSAVAAGVNGIRGRWDVWK